jgi:hypothetical protein
MRPRLQLLPRTAAAGDADFKFFKAFWQRDTKGLESRSRAKFVFIRRKKFFHVFLEID